jgi:hypothetical protein
LHWHFAATVIQSGLLKRCNSFKSVGLRSQIEEIGHCERGAISTSRRRSVVPNHYEAV